MPRHKTSNSTLTGRIIESCLLLFVLSGVFFGKTPGQPPPVLDRPFKKCWGYGVNNGLSRIIASDNEREIILTDDEFKLISMDPRTRRENWTTATGGRLKPGTVSDGKNLFFVTTFEDEQNVRIHTLNSISLQTGLLVWRKRFTEEQDIVLYAVQDEKHIFLSGGNKTLYSIDKAVGNISWKQEFPAPVISFDFISKNYLSILTEDGVYRVDVLNGMIPESWRLNGKPFNRSILKAGYMFLGYPTGEVAKIASDGDRNETLWKIKTGGSIAGLYELEDGVLAASMDNFLYLFTTESGNLRWKRRLGGRFNIKPLIYGRYAVVLNSSDNQASVIELNDGKVVNRIMIEDDNYFLNEPSVIGGFLVLQTFRGIYFFVNTDGNCQ